jgi:RNA polymerase sigma factor (sigma-70 family)
MMALVDVKPLGPAELAALVTWAIQLATAWAEETGTPADEVEGEVVDAMERALLRHDPSGTTVSDYVRRRVRGALIDATRKEKRRRKHEVLLADLEETAPPTIEDDDEALARALGVEGAVLGSPEEALLRAEEQAAIDREVERMPRADRGQYVMFHREGLTWDEISEQTGIPARTLRFHDKRIRDRLAAALRAFFDDDE